MLALYFRASLCARGIFQQTELLCTVRVAKPPPNVRQNLVPWPPIQGNSTSMQPLVLSPKHLHHDAFF